MRFKEFLLREETMYVTLEQGLEAVKDHCTRFLFDVKGTSQWLYRGMNMPVVDHVIIMDHMKERQPKDSSGGYNVFFNLGIELACDVPLIRTRCVFTTGSRQDAKSYGNCYFAFPRGNYKYVWSPDIKDSYIADMQLLERFVKLLHDDAGTPIIAARNVHEIFSAILERSGDSISRAVANMKTHDEMVEEVFASFNMEVKAEQVERAIKKTFEPMYYENDIKEAIHGGDEIMIYESEGHIFIPLALVFDHLREKGLKDSPEEFLTNYFWGAGA
jgi:hypothetical protein